MFLPVQAHPPDVGRAWTGSQPWAGCFIGDPAVDGFLWSPHGWDAFGPACLFNDWGAPVGQSLFKTIAFWPLWASAAFGTALFNPFLILAPGAQLSFLAVAALVFTRTTAPTPELGSKANGFHWCLQFVRKIGGWLGRFVTANVAATAGTAPTVAFHFGTFAWAFLPGNLVMAPILELVAIPLGLLATAVEVFQFPGTDVLGWPAVKAAGLAMRVAGMFRSHAPELRLRRPLLRSAADDRWPLSFWSFLGPADPCDPDPSIPYEVPSAVANLAVGGSVDVDDTCGGHVEALARRCWAVPPYKDISAHFNGGAPVPFATWCQRGRTRRP